jgi:hypothetical protein
MASASARSLPFAQTPCLHGFRPLRANETQPERTSNLAILATLAVRRRTNAGTGGGRSVIRRSPAPALRQRFELRRAAARLLPARADLHMIPGCGPIYRSARSRFSRSVEQASERSTSLLARLQPAVPPAVRGRRRHAEGGRAQATWTTSRPRWSTSSDASSTTAEMPRPGSRLDAPRVARAGSTLKPKMADGRRRGPTHAMRASARLGASGARRSWCRALADRPVELDEGRRVIEHGSTTWRTPQPSAARDRHLRISDRPKCL